MLPIKILLVEDSEIDAELTLAALKNAGISYTVQRVETRETYEAALVSFAPDLVMSDFSMPNFDGLSALNILRHSNAETPFIFVSGTLREHDAISSLKQGATDYVLKSSLARLPSAVERAIAEARERTARREVQRLLDESLENLHRASHFDAVTSLPTRAQFCEHLDALLAFSDAKKMSVTVLDIERFRFVNESMGWDAGNRMLDMVATRLAEALGDREAVCRIGADVFAFYLDAPTLELAVEGVYQCIYDSTRRPFEIDGTELRSAVKYGIAAAPEHGTDADLLLKNAEIALKRAKESIDRYVLYSPTMHSHASEMLNLENQLRIAMADEQFLLHYQPKYDITGKRLLGVEALLRWDSPELGRVAPAEFVPMLEKTGMIVELGGWIIEQAMRDWHAWTEAGYVAPRIAVNVSPVQLQREQFLQQLTAGAAACLDLEITEGTLMTDLGQQAQRLQAIKAAGIGIEIDDFGTGYSSLNYIANLPVDGLKIDRGFIARLGEADSTLKVVSAIIALAHSLGLKVIAEGVETREQWATLKTLKCDAVQGYLFARPLSAQDIERLLPKAERRKGGRPTLVAVASAPRARRFSTQR